ncbi:MAG: tRNA pseudouridine synthase A, partial [Clostridia bacterium]|nr:tRNA pseudouridine synthase A [Clostridia bacterium]
MRIKLTIEYDGTGFSGFQIQPGLRTVQSELENAIFKATGESSRIVGSGRTDTGVHAIAQVAHFDTNKDLGAKYAHALNYYLPNDVRVLAAEKVSQEFHARFSAKSKTYVYVMYERATTSAIYL